LPVAILLFLKICRIDCFVTYVNLEIINYLRNDQKIKFQEIENGIFQEIETFCKIDQKIEKPLGPQGGHDIRVFSPI